MGERFTVWIGRALWAALPVTIGTPLGDAIADWDATARTTATLGLWVAWSLTMAAVLVPHPAALTVWRVMTPAAGTATALAALDGEASIVAALGAAALVGVTFAPPIGSVCVNGPAYANERRYPLRPPGVAVLGLAAAAWTALVAGPVAAALLLADGRWLLGGAVAVAVAPLGALAGRALHGLSRRWLVMVPAGLVVHDPTTLADPVLFQKPVVDSIGPAPLEPAGSRVDLTAGALGLALELRLNTPTDVLVITQPGRRPTAETTAASTLLIAPTRASRVLADAAARGYRVR